MANPAPTINQINAFNATQGTTIDFNIIGGTELVRSNRIYIYDLSDNSLICTHLYVSTESIHELPANTDSSIVYESGKSSADFVNGAQYYAQIQTFTNTAGTQGGSGLSVAKMFWCLVDPTLTITTIPSTISTTSYNVSATYTDTSASVVSNIIQQYQFNLYNAVGSLLQSSGVIVGGGEQQGTSTAYDISYNFTGLSVGSSYYTTVEVTTTQGMSVSAQSNTFTVSIDTPTVGGAIVNNNACDGYISVVSNLSDEYGGSASGEMASFETDSVNNVSSLKVDMEPIQSGSGTPSPTNIRPIRGHSGVNAYVSPTQSADDGTKYSQEFDVSLTPTSTDKVPYTFKAVGRDVYGDRESDKIVGGTVAWNQHLSFSTSSTQGGITRSAVDNSGKVTFTGTRTEVGWKSWMHFGYIANHKVLILANGLVYTSPEKSSGLVILDEYSQAYSFYQHAPYYIFSKNADTTMRLACGGDADDVFDISGKFQLFDLTQMFGSTIADYIYTLEQGTAGAGVAWFRKLFPKDYYPYDPGTLRSVEGVSAHETVGFNQWDEEWEVGSISRATGQNENVTGQMRSKNYIRVLPNTQYYLLCTNNTSGASIAWICYDENKNFISSQWIRASLFTTPLDCHYIRFTSNTAYGATYNNDICINLSWDGERDGEYEEYVKHSYPLDSDLELRGIPKLDASNNLYYDGDTYESDGTVTRAFSDEYVIQASDIYQVNDTYENVIYARMPIKTGWMNSNSKQAINSKFGVGESVYPFDDAKAIGKMAINAWTNNYFFGFAKGTTLEQMKNALAGTTMVAELATPTTETTDPYTNPQVVDNGGTEAYVTTGIVPVGHDTTYLTRDIFGGTLDLVTGVLTVDRVVDTYNGSEAWAKDSDLTGGIHRFYLQNDTIKKYSDYTNVLLSNKCKATVNYQSASTMDGDFAVTAYNITTNLFNRAYIFSKTIDTVNGIKAWLADEPLQFCYELASPQTYQLTPHQIQTLVGQNNVWSEQGDVDVTFNLPISNLLVKRQDASDVSGDWLTLYSQPIAQANDMDFTFIDFTNQYGKTYKYALVPLLTQTQSGVEVEVEGGYTVSDEVQSIFDGVFIADSTGSQKCKANVGYGDVDMNQAVGTITPIGAKYPVVITNSKNQYHNGSISGTIVPDDYYFNGNLSRIDMVNKRNELEQFLTNKRAKIIKDWNSNIWLVMMMDNITCTFNNEYGMGIVNFNANWIEVGDPTNQQDLQATGLIDVGGV